VEGENRKLHLAYATPLPLLAHVADGHMAELCLLLAQECIFSASLSLCSMV